MRSPPTSPTRYVSLLVRHLEQKGLDCAPAVESMGVGLDALKHPEGQFESQRVIDVFRVVAEQGGVQQEAGLLVGKMITLGVLGDLGRAMLACASARDALACCAEFLALIAPSYGMRLSHGATHCTVHCFPVRASPYDMTLKGFDMILGAFDNLLAALLPGNPPAYDAYFVNAAPGHADMYRTLTRARCHFGEPGLPAMRIEIPNEVMATPLPLHDPDELAAQRQRLMQRLQAMPARGSWKDWVCMMLTQAHELQPTQDDVAAIVGISAATLARHLQAEGTSFRKLAMEIRHQRACELLTAGGLSVTQIGRALGYDNPGNFVRAFKAHAGCTPTEFVQSVQGPVTAAS